MLEREFQAKLIREIEERIPGSIALKVETYMQGFPDLLVLYKDRWGVLEVKKNANAHRQPNQEDYVKKLDGMSFARFIYPENKEEVLRDIQQAFGVGGKARSDEPQ